MKNVILILFLPVIVAAGCGEKRGKLITDGLKVYTVQPPDENSFFQWDGLVDRAELIPLETNEQSLIGRFTKGIVSDSNIFILDFHFHTLLQFDITGKFQRRIGNRGRGPGEFLEVRDFCITDSILYTLDYQKIHAYSMYSGEYIESWSFDTENGFNPLSLLVYSKDSYYLWTSNPNVWNPEEGVYHRMRKMQQEKVLAEYFEYDYKVNDERRFYFCNDRSYYFNNGKDTVYKIMGDSVAASFFLDFGNMALSPKQAEDLSRAESLNDFLRSNAFKNINHIFKVNDYIYFRCTGPNAYINEGLIDEKTGKIRLGRYDFRRSPVFFFADNNIMYGYYEPYKLIENENNGADINSCFANLLEKESNIDIEDNPILVKVYLK